MMLNGYPPSVVGQAPLGRLGKSEEFAPTVAFLAGDDAAYLTAADLAVDGGWMNV